MADQEKVSREVELTYFCSLCFASSEGGSWGVGTVENYCLNCGAAGGTIHVPIWAVKEIRRNASWVGSRYYPNDEDKETWTELRALRAFPKIFPGRSASRLKDEDDGKQRWQVRQVISVGDNGKSISVFVEAESAEQAIEAARYSLPYVAPRI